MRRGRPKHPDILTPRQWQVLELLRQGLTNEQIAARLGLTLDGAKYHVSEILTKLGVSSREDAAAWLPQPRRRLPIISWGLLRKLAATGFITAAALVVLAIVATQLRQEGRFGGQDADSSSQAPKEEPAIPDASQILASGDLLSFTLCSETIGWERPSLDEMEDIFTRERFGDGSGPWPWNFALYLADIYWNRAPFANSANAESSAFSGFWGRSEATETISFCDNADWQGVGHQALTVVGHQVLEIKHDGAHVAVRVESASTSYEHVRFRYPADLEYGFESLQVVDGAGQLLYSEHGNHGEGPFEQIQYDQSRELEFAVFYARTPVRTSPLAVGPDSVRFRLFGGDAGGLAPAGGLTVLDQQGRDVLSVAWRGQAELWQPLATLELTAGAYTFRFDTPGHYVLIRDDQSLPPAAAH